MRDYINPKAIPDKVIELRKMATYSPGEKREYVRTFGFTFTPAANTNGGQTTVNLGEAYRPFTRVRWASCFGKFTNTTAGHGETGVPAFCFITNASNWPTKTIDYTNPALVNPYVNVIPIFSQQQNFFDIGDSFIIGQSISFNITGEFPAGTVPPVAYQFSFEMFVQLATRLN